MTICYAIRERKVLLVGNTERCTYVEYRATPLRQSVIITWRPFGTIQAFVYIQTLTQYVHSRRLNSKRGPRLIEEASIGELRAHPSYSYYTNVPR